MRPAPGSLLIASAMLVDPNFARCVILILDSDPNGSLGVILNRPSEVPVGEVLTAWQDVTSEPGVLFRGGPVELNAALAVGSLRGESGEDLPSGWRPLGGSLGAGSLGAGSLGAGSLGAGSLGAGALGAGSLGIVDLDHSPEDFLGLLTALRVYAGYTGWGAEQLDGEIAEGSWHVVPALPADVFSSSPDRLWGAVLRRQPPPLSMLATLPEDASLN